MKKLLIVIPVLFIIGLIAYMLLPHSPDGDYPGRPRPELDGGSSEGQDRRTVLPAHEDTLTLANLGGVKFGPYDRATGRSGDVLFPRISEDSKMIPPFIPFGHVVTTRDRTFTNPNFEYRNLASALPITSGLEGIVVDVKDQGPNDKEIIIIPREGSRWSIGYDHVSDSTLARGDKVQPDDIIGKAAPEHGTYRFEIQINYDDEGRTKHICPLTLINPESRKNIEREVNQFMLDWNSHIGTQVYQTMYGGCVNEEMYAVE